MNDTGKTTLIEIIEKSLDDGFAKHIPLTSDFLAARLIEAGVCLNAACTRSGASCYERQMSGTEYVSREAAMDYGSLFDWYISSVSDDNPPVWTGEHIEELLKDFLVIPKETPAADVAPVKHGHWIEEGDIQICSECGEEHSWQDYRASYCDVCGAKMDGGGQQDNE